MKQLQDYYFKMAKKEGFAARSVYKLQQIDDQHSLLKKNSNILELGAAPGGWSKYILKIISSQGKLVAIDLKNITQINEPNFIFFQLDFFQADFYGYIEKFLPFDCILSDMAPNTTGIKSVDQSNSFEMLKSIIELAPKCLKKGGKMLLKNYQGPKSAEIPKILKNSFSEVKIIKPPSSRSESFEIFFLAINYKNNGQ